MKLIHCEWMLHVGRRFIPHIGVVHLYADNYDNIYCSYEYRGIANFIPSQIMDF